MVTVCDMPVDAKAARILFLLFIPVLLLVLILFVCEICRIVGMGGIGDSLLLVAFCGSCTFLTAISLSAIATNGAMKVR